MGYYCTVPQCTSLAGKTKNVKFHRFPRDVTMADKWNIILKRGKPYTKYSKVCSLHFTQADYNVTTMGQWKTLSKDAVPSQNLPRLNPDGTVMVIRKSRTVKYRDGRKDSTSDNKSEKWSVISQSHIQNSTVADHPNIDTAHAYRSLQTLSAIASTLPPQTLPQPPIKPKKQDAIMQTDPVESEEDDSQPDNSYNEPSEPSFNEEIQYMAQYKEKEYAYKESENKKDYAPKDFTKQDDYIPRTNEEYNKEAEKYALERKSLNGFEKPAIDYHRLQDGYKNAQDMYNFDKDGVYPRNDYTPYSYQNSVELLRHQQHNIEMLQHRPSENQNFFTENDIKQEVDLSNEDDKYNMYNRKDPLDTTSVHMYTHRSVVQQQRLLDHLQHHVKQEPETSAGESVMQPQSSPYYSINGHSNNTGPYYDQLQRPPPGPESLISKQNALAAHPQLWQNMKRPFYYSEHSHYPSLHRYDDLTRILQ